mmetsp:Transcript_6429/g.8460  ORF Transcript_6429/g.8460 Transcript_6429/m.8460 type:complete len:179 (-) Transcript_6429:361-897(-)
MGSGCGVVFLGMDSPEIPTSEVARALYHAKSRCAFLCPADDGGYGMLGVPPRIDGKKVFQGVRWSSELTAVSQIKALTDNGIQILLGRIMYDIDVFKDLMKLAERLCDLRKNSEKVDCCGDNESDDVLNIDSRSPFTCELNLQKFRSSCSNTWNCLIKIGLIREDRPGIFVISDDNSS